MKKLFFVLIWVVCCSVGMYGQLTNKYVNKRVAVLEVVDRTNALGFGAEYMIRSNIGLAVSGWFGYEGYVGDEIADIMKNQDYQSTGRIKSAWIKRLGKNLNADYVILPEAMVGNGGMVRISASLYNAERAKVIKTEAIEVYKDVSLYEKACYDLVEKLLVDGIESEPFKLNGGDSDEEIIIMAEIAPKYPGGMEAMYDFIRQNMAYPESARRNSIEGRVLATFVVEKDGSLSNINVKQDIGGGCGMVCVRILEAMPKWIPGKQRGEPIRAQFTLPLSFRLN